MKLIGKYLLGMVDKGLTYEAGMKKFLEIFEETDFSGVFEKVMPKT